MVSEQKRINCLRGISGTEIGLYCYMFWAAFGHLIFYIEFLAPALLCIVAVFAVISAPGRIKFSFLPLFTVMLMVFIDFLFHSIDIKTMKAYLFWSLLFVTSVSLHRDSNFLQRCVFMLVVLLFAHFIFLKPFYDNAMRLSLDYNYKLIFENPDDLAYWCGFAGLACLFSALKGSFFKRGLSILAMLASFTVMLSTVARAALIAIILSVFLFAVLSFSLKRLLNYVLIICVGIVISLLILSTNILDSHLNSIENNYESRFMAEESTGYRFSGRVPFFLAAVNVVLNHPLAGTGKNEIRAKNERWLNSPHNFFLAIAVHYGIFPAMAVLMLWLIVLWRALTNFAASKPNDRIFKIELFVMAFYLFFMSNTSNGCMLYFFCVLYMSKILTMDSDEGWIIERQNQDHDRINELPAAMAAGEVNPWEAQKEPQF